MREENQYKGSMKISQEQCMCTINKKLIKLGWIDGSVDIVLEIQVWAPMFRAQGTKESHLC